MLIIFIILNIFTYLFNLFFINKYLHILQLKNYSFDRFLRFFLKKSHFYILFNAFLILVTIIFKKIVISVCVDVVSIIFNIAFINSLIKSKKTPLIKTKKLKNILIISILLSLPSVLTISPIICLYFILLPPLANALNWIDKFKNKHYLLTAQKKLKSSHAKVIAITGSNGKTSVKNILQKMLQTQYKVMSSPSSFNTPLGIAKFINENDISTLDFLILEYGARRKHQIKKLCALFGADYGIITTISAQHLETFKSILTIYKTKKELPDFLQNKPCIYNLDNLLTLKMFEQKLGSKFGVSLIQKSDLFATNIEIKNYHTEFDLVVKNKTYHATTKLLGKHNITNILLCVSLSLLLQIDVTHILSSINDLPFTPHRLELIQTYINIFDDSYNCSIASAKASLEVISALPNKKMIVTPGIIEGGKFEYRLNYELGKQLTNFDYLVFVGSHNKTALTYGVLSQNKNKKILYAQSLNQATQYYNLLKPNDNLLFLNDLPDDYN